MRLEQQGEPIASFSKYQRWMNPQIAADMAKHMAARQHAGARRPP
jgi:hypothetical protein